MTISGNRSGPDARTSWMVVPGFVLGGLGGGMYGHLDYEEACRRARAAGEIVDFIPIGIPMFALFGAIAGAALGWLFAPLILRDRSKKSVPDG